MTTSPALTRHQQALLDTALAVRAGGVSLVPVSAATKRPIEALLPMDPDTGHGSWRDYQHRLPSDDEIRYWISKDAQLALVAGAVSGGVLILDFDEPAKWGAWLGLADIRDDQYPVQQTGGGGYQIAWRVADPGKNDKLAYVSDATKFDGRRIAIETRGEGGYAIIAPSLHPSGNHYQMLAGSFAQIPTISQAESDRLVACARQLCEAPYTTQQIQMMGQAMQQPSPSRASANGSVSVIDLFNQATPIEEALRDAGYTHCYHDRWSPPGAPKQRDSVIIKNSKAYHHDTDYPLADGHWHDAFDVWCYYRHHGDVKGACREAAAILCLPPLPPSPAPQPSSPPPVAPPPVPPPTPQQAFHPILLDAPMTDVGNAECLAALCGDHLRYCRTNKQWLAWSQTYWRWDAMAETRRLMWRTVRHRREAAATLTDPDKAKKLFSWTYTSEMTNKTNAALEAATSLALFDTEINDYDQNPMLAGLPNGVLDLDQQRYRPAQPADMITMRLGSLYDPHATCPRWLQFMSEVFAGDQDLVSYVQRAIGYTLTGITSERKFFLCFGDGYNGKSVLLDILSELMQDYSATAAFATFDAEKRSESSNDLAALKGKRIVVISESNQDRRLNEALMKRLTGKQDKVTCRFLHKEFFEYRPTFKIWMALNHLPIIRGQDKGIWSRVHIIPFTQDFEKSDNKHLTDQLLEELPGILNWALAGLSDWRQHGLNPPAVVLKHVDDYRATSDNIGQFLDEYTVSDPGAVISATDLYEEYYLACRNRGERIPMQFISFCKALGAKGYISHRATKDARKQTFYAGLRRRTEHDT